jgi:hypothetical protein
VCDSRGTGTNGFDLINPKGCNESVEAAKKVFTVINTDRQAGQSLINATNTEIDRQIQNYADADPSNPADPALNGLAYAGRLLGLAAVGGQQSGIATRSPEDEANQATYLVARTRIDKGQATSWPEFMANGRLMTPDEVRAKLGANRVDEYYGALNDYALATKISRSIKYELRGEYE